MKGYFTSLSAHC